MAVRLTGSPSARRDVRDLRFFDPAVREVIRRPCRIVYRLDPREEQVEIVRVWHAARGRPDIG
jgi:plasmid stabilization system protein ParE